MTDVFLGGWLLLNTYISRCGESTDPDENEQERDENFPMTPQQFGMLITETGDHGLQSSERAVQSQGDQHGEKEDRPDG